MHWDTWACGQEWCGVMAGFHLWGIQQLFCWIQQDPRCPPDHPLHWLQCWILFLPRPLLSDDNAPDSAFIRVVLDEGNLSPIQEARLHLHPNLPFLHPFQICAGSKTKLQHDSRADAFEFNVDIFQAHFECLWMCWTKKKYKTSRNNLRTSKWVMINSQMSSMRWKLKKFCGI